MWSRSLRAPAGSSARPMAAPRVEQEEVVAVAAKAPAITTPQRKGFSSSATMVAVSSVRMAVLVMGLPPIRAGRKQPKTRLGSRPCNASPISALGERNHGDIVMRSGCLWLLGVPLPIIIILWLITGHA